MIIPWRSSLEAGRGGAAVTTWIFRGGGDGCKGVSQRRRFRRGRGYKIRKLVRFWAGPGSQAGSHDAGTVGRGSARATRESA